MPADWRDIQTGRVIPTEPGGYCDQPALIALPDGRWLCSVTTSPGSEGSTGQYVSVMNSSDNGKSWSSPLRPEPPEDGRYWESAYSKLLCAPNGRVFCFYCYNADHLRPEDTGGARADMGGALCYRFSDDGGQRWSPRRTIPLRDSWIDKNAPNVGPDGRKIPLFWNVAKPLVRGDGVYLPLTKLSSVTRPDAFGEGLLLYSPDLFADPATAAWQTLPDGDGILAVPGSGPVAEEHCFVYLSDGTLACTFRTAVGRVGYTLSRDGGHSFETPRFLTFPDGTPVCNGRANTTFWRLDDGRYLYWFSNRANPGWDGRNPIWVCGALEYDTPDGKDLRLLRPEVLLFSTDPTVGISYPDLLQSDGRYFITETQKTVARVHEIPAAFIDSLFA